MPYPSTANVTFPTPQHGRHNRRDSDAESDRSSVHKPYSSNSPQHSPYIEYQDPLMVLLSLSLCWGATIIAPSVLTYNTIPALILITSTGSFSLIYSLVMLPICCRFARIQGRKGHLAPRLLPPSARVPALVFQGIISLLWLIVFGFTCAKHAMFGTILAKGHALTVTWVYYELSLVVLGLVFSWSVFGIQVAQRVHYSKLWNEGSA